jgi:ubiquinol-cytochrome c reductase cytochrome b subunit
VTKRIVAWLDRNLGGTRLVRESLRHIFPDHWSFFLGEIALYCFIVLVVTGTYLALFFHPSSAQVVYHGSYVPLRGVVMSDAYKSVVDISFDVRAGLLVRQVHHWAALVFAGALVLHLGRMFFTGAYRKPRRINWVIGLTLLLMVLANGFTGYSVPDDLLSGTGLRIAYSITESIPLVGPQMASWMFGGSFPSPAFVPRLLPIHIFLVPALIAGLLSLHLGLLWRQRHTQYPGEGRDDGRIVGTQFAPAYALRTLGYFFLVAGVLAVLGGFFQINPIWIYGPYQAAHATVAAQPDWYTGWLEGALRLTSNWDIQIGGFLLPGIFWPAVVMPGVLFGFLFTWPWVDGFVSGDQGFHNVLTRPCARPIRMAIGVGITTALIVLLFAGGDDVFASLLQGSEQLYVMILRPLLLALPPIAAISAYMICRRSSVSSAIRT